MPTTIECYVDNIYHCQLYSNTIPRCDDNIELGGVRFKIHNVLWSTGREGLKVKLFLRNI